MTKIVAAARGIIVALVATFALLATSSSSYAETGADYLSVGALTHSAPALNLSLEVEEVG